MKKALTAVAVKNLKPKEKRYYCHDENCTGLCVMVTPKGNKTFYLVKRSRGSNSQYIRLGRFPEMTLMQARQSAREKLTDLESGRASQPVKQTMEWGQLVKLFIENAKTRINSWKDYEQLDGMFLGDWAKKRVDTITKPLVFRKHASVGEKQPARANRLLSCISQVWKFGLNHGHIAEGSPNPAEKIKKFYEQQRTRYLSPEEMEDFLRVCDEWRKFGGWKRRSAELFLLLLLTGQRSGKVSSMKFADVNLDWKTWSIGKNKNGDPLTVVLVDEAVELIRGRDSGEKYVFPAPGERGYYYGCRKAWHQLCDELGWTDTRPHDLRHPHASWQAMNNVSLPAIGKSLGHKSLASTQRYAHLSLDSVRPNVENATAAMRAPQTQPQNTGDLTAEERALIASHRAKERTE